MPAFFPGVLSIFVTGNIGKFTGNVLTFENEETPIALQSQEQILKLCLFSFHPSGFSCAGFQPIGPRFRAALPHGSQPAMKFLRTWKPLQARLGGRKA
ncbi:MAG: hypothetical protein WBY75_22085, partial [Terracidiphilus sp.]